MNEKEYRRVVEALVEALELAGKCASTPAHYEAMAKVALALVEVAKLNECEG